MPYGTVVSHLFTDIAYIINLVDRRTTVRPKDSFVIVLRVLETFLTMLFRCGVIVTMFASWKYKFKGQPV